MLKALTQRCRTSERALERYVWSASWLRGAEAGAAASQGITLSQLMERAGGAAARVCFDTYPHTKHWLILVGPGNNGGDGYIIASLARQRNVRVTVLAMPHSKPLPVEASAAKALFERCGGRDEELHEGTAIPDDVDLVVDGLLGTGITGAPRDLYASVLERVNGLDVPRVAIDIPSGLNAETGVAAGACFRADHTVTFISLKPGLLTGQAREYVGQLHYDTLELSSWLSQPAHMEAAVCRRVTYKDLGTYFGTLRPATAHKGTNGKVVLIGGERGYGGAILMSAEAALRSGAGLTRVLTRPEHVTPLLTRCPEVMVTAVAGAAAATGGGGGVGVGVENEEEEERACYEAVGRELGWSSVVAIGPGLGRGAFARGAMRAVMEHVQQHPTKPVVFDADALHELRERYLRGGECAAGVRVRLPLSIMTPHPGEAANLLRCTVADVEVDRVTAAQRLAALLGGTCLLKGAGTIVCQHQPSGGEDAAGWVPPPPHHSHCAIIDAGNAGMASGGMGDVLTGVMAGVAAQRLLGAFDTTCAAALTHSVAADLVVSSTPGRGTRGVAATELLQYIPICVNAPRSLAAL